MNTVSISQLKMNPMSVLLSADDYPVEIQNRSKTAGYFVGTNLFEKMIAYMEDIEDKKAIETIDLDDKMNFEDFAKSLGI